jgi:hypothetical protein
MAGEGACLFPFPWGWVHSCFQHWLWESVTYVIYLPPLPFHPLNLFNNLLHLFSHEDKNIHQELPALVNMRAYIKEWFLIPWIHHDVMLGQ